MIEDDNLAADSALSGSLNYVKRTPRNSAVDPYPELTSKAGSRIPGWRLWLNSRFRHSGSPTYADFQPDGHPLRASKKGKGIRPHHGIDICGTRSDQAKKLAGFVAPYDCTILYAGLQGDYGYKIELKFDAYDIGLVLAHCRKFAPGLKTGAKIKKGQLLAYEGGIGSGGQKKYADHLHLEVYDVSGLNLSPGASVLNARTAHNAGRLLQPWWIFDLNKQNG